MGTCLCRHFVWAHCQLLCVGTGLHCGHWQTCCATLGSTGSQAGSQSLPPVFIFFFFRFLSFNKVTQKVTAVTLPAIVIYTWGLPTNEPVMIPLAAAQCPCSPFCAWLHVLSVPYLCLMNRPLNWQAANGCCAFCICRSTGSETLPRISY